MARTADIHVHHHVHGPHQSMFSQVKEFHEVMGLDVSNGPIDMKQLHPHGPESSSPLWRLRAELVREEYEEFMDAMAKEDLVEIADAICDLHYVLSGTSVSFGIPEDECFAEVHASNMSKVDADGTIHRRDDGKIIKGDGFFAPDLHSIIYPEPMA